MPVIRFPANYPLPRSQAALLNDPDALEGFDPTAPSVNAGDPTPIPPSPANAAAAQNANTVALPPLNGNGASPKIKMPPGRNGNAMPPPEAVPPVSAPASAPTAPPTGAPPPDIAAGLAPPTGEPKTTSEKLASLQPPDQPSNNWAQRLGLAVLSLTKFAPVANQIIHPKWAEQARAYGATKADLESKQQEEIAQGQAEASEAQKEAVAEWRHAQAEPHRGQQEIDPQYAQENMPWLKPDANGQFWVDKAVANTLSKPDKAASLKVVPAGSTVVDESGKVLYTAPAKDETPKNDFEKFFLPNYAKVLGKTMDQMTPAENIAALGEFKKSNADPDLRASQIALRGLMEQTRQMQLSQQPTQDWADLMADTLLNHHMAPEQINQLIGGFGPQAQLAKRMITTAALRKDPTFDFEQAASDFNFGKNPAFQSTVRMMDSATNSMNRLQQSANALANGRVRSINALINMGKNQFNSVDLKKFQTDALLVGDEVGKVIQGGGTGSGVSDAKLKQAQDLFKTSDDPTVIGAAINEVSQILNYRRKAVTRGTYMENVPAMIPEAGGKSGTPIAVKAPDGKTYHFKDQKAADDFKKDAGIQ
jgi:hypothetical protein